MFDLHAPFQPAGDQPQAIEKIIRSIEEGEKYQTLMGVTGSGKTFTMANVIAHFNIKEKLFWTHESIFNKSV